MSIATLSHLEAFTVAEVLERLKISRSLFDRAVREGRIKIIRLGPNRIGVSYKELERVLEEGLY